MTKCSDCQRIYGSAYGFPDLVVPDDVWLRISPRGSEGGLLCPSCMCGRAAGLGIQCRARFMSGPFTEHQEGGSETMTDDACVRAAYLLDEALHTVPIDDLPSDAAVKIVDTILEAARGESSPASASYSPGSVLDPLPPGSVSIAPTPVTLRDQIMMAALPAVTPAALGTAINRRTASSILDDMAEMAYLLADAVLAVKEKTT